MSDLTTVHFRFDCQVSVEVADGIELNHLQKRLEEYLRQPSFHEQLTDFTQSEVVTNKQVVVSYKGMILGRHVHPDVDERQPADEVPEVDTTPLPSALPETHQPSVVPTEDGRPVNDRPWGAGARVHSGDGYVR